jgi:hypothetical protein
MIGAESQRWWRRSVSVGPAAAATAGIALGAAIGGLVAFPYFDRMSYVLWLLLAWQGGAWGYISWLKKDRARDERFQRMVSLATLVAIAVFLLAFPDLWWRMRQADGGFIVCCFGGICAASMLVVGAGWGFMHLVEFLSSLFWSHAKATTASSIEGVWDRELDQDLPAGKRDA